MHTDPCIEIANGVRNGKRRDSLSVVDILLLWNVPQSICQQLTMIVLTHDLYSRVYWSELFLFRMKLNRWKSTLCHNEILPNRFDAQFTENRLQSRWLRHWVSATLVQKWKSDFMFTTRMPCLVCASISRTRVCCVLLPIASIIIIVKGVSDVCGNHLLWRT